MKDSELRDVALRHFKKVSVSWPAYEKSRLVGKYRDDGAYTEWGQGFAALRAMQRPKNISLRNQVGELLKQTEKTFRAWEKTKYKTGEREKTHWYRALYVLGQIEDEVVPVPPPQPATPDIVKNARNIVFCTDHALQAKLSPLHNAVALTADPAPTYQGGEGQDYVSIKEIVRQFKEDQHRRVLGWGNQSQIGIARIKKFVSDYNLDGAIYQSEDVGELADLGVAGDGSIIPGSLVATENVIHIGNPTSWTDQQRATVTKLCNENLMAVIVEVYNNLMPWVWPENFDSKGVPVASWGIGLYDGSRETASGRYTTTAEYKSHTRPDLWEIICSYISKGSGTQDKDVQELP
jgi:hypothetical protein